jgi:hypothetical protein
VPPFVVAATWALGLSFAGVFVAGFGSAALPLSVLVGLVWIVVIGGSLWAYLRQRNRARLLSIDDFRGTLSLAHAAARRPVRTAAVRDLQAVGIREKSKRDSDGDLQQAYAVAILKSKPASGSRNWCLVAGWSQPQAQQLADWLGTRLRLPVVSASSQKNRAD